MKTRGVAPAADPIRQGSRDRVLAVLRDDSQPMGITQICAATRLSPGAIRFHLDHLIGLGAVHAVKDPHASGSGRPALLYSAAPQEAVDPSAAYRALAGLLASELVRSVGPRAASEAGRAWATSLLKGRAIDGTDPVPLVMSVLEEGGFKPVRSADGSTIALHRCPFLDLALEQPAVVCGVHLGLVSGVLSVLGASAAVHLLPVLDSDGPCLVRFGATGSSSSHSPVATPIEENAS
jgi:predicted ArsR family transcriptional regulator